MPTTPVHVRLDTDLLARLDELAKAEGVNRSTALTRALERGLVAQRPAERVAQGPSSTPVVAQSGATEAAVAQPPVDPMQHERALRERLRAEAPVARSPTRSSADDLRARLAETRERQACCSHPKVKRTGRFCGVCGGVVVEEP